MQEAGSQSQPAWRCKMAMEGVSVFSLPCSVFFGDKRSFDVKGSNASLAVEVRNRSFFNISCEIGASIYGCGEAQCQDCR